MPTYAYACEPCLTIYKGRHGMSETPDLSCPDCGGGVERQLSAPQIVRESYSSPTEAKFANLTQRAEEASEIELQKVYRTIWMPEPVKHDPDDEH